MREQTTQIGSGFALNGILSLPQSTDRTKPAIIIVNSGFLHHVGACRLSVQLARRVADEGFVALRFDLSGLGDSDVRRSSLDPEERVIEEIVAAMDHLEDQLGIERFVCYGLCAGAQNGFKTAIVDDRIVGLIGIDNFAFHTPGYHMAHYLRRLFKLSHWASFLKRKLLPGKDTENIEIQEAGESIWPYPPRHLVEKGYQHLVDRRVQFLYFYTGGWEHQFNHKNQFFGMYPSVKFGSLLELHYWPHSSHLMMEPGVQSDFLNTVASWANQRFAKDAVTQDVLDQSPQVA